MISQTRCIAHEIRNQISICELYSQIIKKNIEKEGINNESINNALKCINKSLKIMSNNLVDLKSLDNLCLRIFNLEELIKLGIDMSVVYIQDKDIKISILNNSSVMVKVDENRFLASLVNILKNASEAINEKGNIVIKISTQKDIAYIDIQNDGEKIPQDIQDHIFEEGYTTKSTGNGLGLAICKENLEMFGANLILKKSDNNVTEFEISLPIFSDIDNIYKTA